MNNTFPLQFIILVGDDSDGESDRNSDLTRLHSDTSSRTSVDLSMRSASPARSVLSVTNSIREESIADEHGRGVNTTSQVYRLPADAIELARLKAQHEMLKKIVGTYTPYMYEVMADDIPGETKAILDLGCGSGDWIIGAANDFPNCRALGIDLIPMQSVDMPSNCRSEGDDVNLGLEHHNGDYNCVRIHLVCTGIRDYYRLIEQASHVLRHGGLLDLLEYGFRVHDEHKQLITVSTDVLGPPWFPLWLAHMYSVAGRLGGSLDASRNLHSWVKGIRAFTDVVHNEIWTPLSPWVPDDDPQSKLLNEHAVLMREDVKEFLKSGRPLLLSSGLSEALVDELEQNSRQELDMAYPRYYILLEHVYARRR